MDLEKSGSGEEASLAGAIMDMAAALKKTLSSLSEKEAEAQAIEIKTKIGALEAIKARQEECATFAIQIIRQQYLRYKVTAEMNRNNFV